MRRSIVASVASVAAVLVLAAVFGVIDARLQDFGFDHGSGQALVWISNMSAAYLMLAFFAGRVVARRRLGSVLAVLLGLTATVVALLAFYAWQVTEYNFTPVLAENQLHRYVLGGIFSGPLFGWLGYRWGRWRSWYAAAAIVAALFLEPYAWRAHLGFMPRPLWVWNAEQLFGALVAAFFAMQAVRSVRATRTMRP